MYKNYLAQVVIPNQFNTPFGKTKGFADLISIILKNSIIIAGVIMILLILFGGIAIITSAGNGNTEGAAKGKNAATTGVIGFLIVFSAYWIIQIIEIITGTQILNSSL